MEMEVPELRIQEETVDEVDLDSDLFKTTGNINENLLKPKQCRRCLLLFTPEDAEDNFCSVCKEEGFMPEDVKLKPCETEGCENQVKGKTRFCVPCQDRKQKQRQKDYYKDTKPVHLVDHAVKRSHAAAPKKEISTKDSPFEKLIKGVFFTFENEVESVTFKLIDGSKFLIGRIDNG